MQPAGKGARIDVVGIGKRYLSGNQREVRALENISFSIDGNEFCAIIGPSGCGKSTLLGIMAGYLQASEGAVYVDDEKVMGPHPDRTVVFQDFALFPWMTAGRNIQSALRARGTPRDSRAELTREYLGLVHLEHVVERYPF